MDELTRLLQVVVHHGGSDLFVTADAPPSVKINGTIQRVTKEPLSASKVDELVYGCMDKKQREAFDRHSECNFALSVSGTGRFRVSALSQRGASAMVLRRIETQIPTLESLGLPPVISDLAMTKRGLVILVGATGTGKSSSVAAMIGHRNRNTCNHIMTVEDPIEFIHQHRKSIVTQREVGVDTESFGQALKNALRQAPDVILIGEIRSAGAMEYAVAFAETGHLCLATLHANNANQALDRIITFFPPEQHNQIWMDLSLNLKAIMAQQLIPTPDGGGRVSCVEVLVNTPIIQDRICKGEVGTLKELMGRNNDTGMQTFDQALYARYEAGEITYRDALAHADSENDLRLMIKLGVDAHSAETLAQSTKGLAIQGESS